MKDYNIIIKEFIDHWENNIFSGKEQYIAKSVSFRIIDLFYSKLKGNKKLDSISDNNLEHSDWKYKSIHYLYYFFWSIKWIVFKFIFIGIVDDIRLFNLMPQRKTSKDYILKILNNKKKYALNFSIIHDKSLLINTKVFCIPIGFSYRFEKTDDSKVEKLFHTLKEFCWKDFNIELPEYFKNEIKKSFQFQNLFDKLLKETFISMSKKFYSDYDFMSINRLLVHNLNSLGIITYSIDHAIFFYEHLYTKRESKNFLTWGEYSKNWLERNCNIKSAHINIYGKQLKQIEQPATLDLIKKKQWLYLSQSYYHPVQMIQDRTFDEHLRVVKNLHNLLRKIRLGKELKLIIHPKDVKNKKLYESNFNPSLFDSSQLKNVELIFFEDTSFIFQFFKWNVPLIYIDSKNNLSIKNSLKKVAYFLNNDENYEEQILDALTMKIDMNVRHETLKYFFSPQDL